jgi:hypothetical protein
MAAIVAVTGSGRRPDGQFVNGDRGDRRYLERQSTFTASFRKLNPSLRAWAHDAAAGSIRGGELT